LNFILGDREVGSEKERKDQMITPIEKEPDTREHVLSTAAQLFAERGFANVSIRDICDEAGVTAPTIYHYFGSKDRLFQAAIRKRLNLRGFRGALIKAVESQTEPAAKLRVFIYEFLTGLPRDFFNPGMFLVRSTTIYRSSMERVSSELKSIEDLALKILCEGMDKGIFRLIDPIKARGYLMNILLSYVLGEVHYHQIYKPDEEARFIYDMFTMGLNLRSENE
jgi:AcrR family transcriptional regulator